MKYLLCAMFVLVLLLPVGAWAACDDTATNASTFRTKLAAVNPSTGVVYTLCLAVPSTDTPAEYLGPFILPNFAGGGRVRITSAGTIPAEGVQPTAASVATNPMPILRGATDGSPVFNPVIGTHNFSLVGLHILPCVSGCSPSTFTLISRLYYDRNGVYLTIPNQPTGFVFDRIYAPGVLPNVAATGNGLEIAGHHHAVANSVITNNSHPANTGPAQADSLSGTWGQYIWIYHNTLSSAGEDLMIGAENSGQVGYMPDHWWVVRNLFLVPTFLDGCHALSGQCPVPYTGPNFMQAFGCATTCNWDARNISEMKSGTNVVWDGNEWDGSGGYIAYGAFQITARNGSMNTGAGAEGWKLIDNVTITNNHCHNIVSCIQLKGADEYYITCMVAGSCDDFAFSNPSYLNCVVDANDVFSGCNPTPANLSNVTVDNNLMHTVYDPGVTGNAGESCFSITGSQQTYDGPRALTITRNSCYDNFRLLRQTDAYLITRLPIRSFMTFQNNVGRTFSGGFTEIGDLASLTAKTYLDTMWQTYTMDHNCIINPGNELGASSWPTATGNNYIHTDAGGYTILNLQSDWTIGGAATATDCLTGSTTGGPVGFVKATYDAAQTQAIPTLSALEALVMSGTTWTLTITPAGTGTGTTTGAGTYADGTVVTMTETPNAGSSFGGWTGTGCTTGTVTLIANTTCTATFTLNPQTTLKIGGTLKIGAGTTLKIGP